MIKMIHLLIFKKDKVVYSITYVFASLPFVILFYLSALMPIYAQESLEQSPIIQRIINPINEMVPPIGTNDSSIMIVEFGDYQCIHCANFNRNVKDLLISEYVDTGQASFMYKDFPVNDEDDKLSSVAAEASYCAAEQDKFWEYHDELFRNSERDSNQNWVTPENLNRFATNVGINDVAKFEDCLNSHKYLQLVEENESLARMLGLPSTPSFIIANTNGTSTADNNTRLDEDMILMIGEHPITDFGEAIDKIHNLSDTNIAM